MNPGSLTLGTLLLGLLKRINWKRLYKYLLLLLKCAHCRGGPALIAGAFLELIQANEVVGRDALLFLESFGSSTGAL